MRNLSMAALALMFTNLSFADARFTERQNQQFTKIQNTAFVKCIVNKGGTKQDIRFKSNRSTDKAFITEYQIDETDISFIYDIERDRLLTKMNGFYYKNEIEKEKDGNGYVYYQVSSLTQSALLQNLDCQLMLGRETFQKIVEDQVHINVHPHRGYDPAGETVEITQQLLNDPSMDQVILLEYQGRSEPDLKEFLTGEDRDFKLGYEGFPVIDLIVPEKASLKVAPTGRTPFDYDQEKLEVFYTGGTHNYCMWNSSMRLIDALVAKKDNRELTINYIKEGIVVQAAGILGSRWRSPIGTSRSDRKFGNSLAKVFSQMSEKKKQKYHSAYLASMRIHLQQQKLNMFSKVTINYTGDEFAQSIEVEGTGSGEYILNINYIE